MEGLATYMLSEKWEIVPDFRMSIKPEEAEYIPRLGVIYKLTKSNFQFVNQVKWQLDMDNLGNVDHGVRYPVFTNRKLTDKLISNFAFEAFYLFSDGFNGFEFVRFGPGIAYIINAQHTVNFNYLLSAKNNRQYWEWAGIPVVQLIININKGYKYLPAKYL